MPSVRSRCPWCRSDAFHTHTERRFYYCFKCGRGGSFDDEYWINRPEDRMSTFKVTVEKVTVFPHPNADRLDLAEVGRYRAVVGKDQFRTGDYALYIPEQAVLPDALIDELGLTGKLAGSDKNRVKAVRLRGELSQGIVCRPAGLKLAWDCACETGVGEGCLGCAAYARDQLRDFAADLGITKWIPPVPTHMAGQVVGAPDLIRWCDIENIKRFPDMFSPGEPVVATEKIHGTCCLVTYRRGADDVLVSSKGNGAKNLALVKSDTNLYWRAVRRYRLDEVAAFLCSLFDADGVGLFGEVFGQGVQDMTYGAVASADDTLGYAMFDIALDKGGVVSFLDAEVWDLALTSLPKDLRRDLRTVPVLYRGPYDYAKLAALAEGVETVSGVALHLREGLVVRPDYERRDGNGRVIAKFVSEAYLTRGGNVTEYE